MDRLDPQVAGQIRGSTIVDLAVESDDSSESYLKLTLDGGRTLEVRGDINVFTDGSLVRLSFTD
jgi:uncharacterized protein (DUF1810 family)